MNMYFPLFSENTFNVLYSVTDVYNIKKIKHRFNAYSKESCFLHYTMQFFYKDVLASHRVQN